MKATEAIKKYANNRKVFFRDSPIKRITVNISTLNAYWEDIPLSAEGFSAANVTTEATVALDAIMSGHKVDVGGHIYFLHEGSICKEGSSLSYYGCVPLWWFKRTDHKVLPREEPVK